MQTDSLLIRFETKIPAPGAHAAARGVALFIGAFTLINLVAGLRSPGFDGNLWWIDLRFLPAIVARGVLLAGAITLLACALMPPRGRWGRLLAVTGLVALIAAALANCAQFYTLLSRGSIATAVPLPLSALAAAALIWIARTLFRPAKPASRGRCMATLTVAALGCALLFPLLQMFCFGKTDYRRPADAAVVFGARAYADGRPSDALADRVRTACDLYRQGLVRTLIFSGGPGDGTIHETESMKRMAVGLGVRPENIVLDRDGLNTWATVKNSERLIGRQANPRVLVVSHFYHLPRIKLSYQREGIEVCTVPAKESYLLRQLPFNMAREVAALWVYYLRPLPQLALHA